MSGLEQQAPEKHASKNGLLIGLVWSLAVLLLLACPASVGGGDLSPLAAWGLTFLPGLLIISQVSRFKDPQQVASLVLLAMGFRVVVAFSGAFLLLLSFPEVSRNVLLGWLGGFYLAALALEIYLIMSVNSLWSGVQPAVSKDSSAQLQEARR